MEGRFQKLDGDNTTHDGCERPYNGNPYLDGGEEVVGFLLEVVDRLCRPVPLFIELVDDPPPRGDNRYLRAGELTGFFGAKRGASTAPHTFVYRVRAHSSSSPKK